MEKIIIQLAAEDIEQTVDLALDSFYDDSYFVDLFPKEKQRKKHLRKIFLDSISFCVQENLAFGIKDEDSLIAFILCLDYDKLRKTDVKHLSSIFGFELNRVVNLGLDRGKAGSSQDEIFLAALECGAYLMYLLSIAVKTEYRKQGIASQLVDFVIQKFPNYCLMGDVSNTHSLSIYEKRNFQINKLADNYFLIQKEPEIKLFEKEIKQSVFLAFPSESLYRRLFPNSKNNGFFDKIEGYTTIKSPHSVDDFMVSFTSECEAFVVEVSYNELLTYQRFVNLSITKEVILKTKNTQTECFLYCLLQERKTPPLYNSVLNNMLEIRQQEWDIIPDGIISFPIEYIDLEQITQKSVKSYDKTIAHLLDVLDFRTHYESGVPKRWQSNGGKNSNSFKDRIKRYYLGKIEISIFEESNVETYIKGGDQIGQPALVDVILSIDTYSNCGVVSIISLSLPFLLSHFLDNVIRNQLMVRKNDNWVNFYEMINIDFGLIKRGSPKAFVNIHKDRSELSDNILSSLLFLETIYAEDEGMGCIVDKDILQLLGDKNGLGQYKYASVYAYSNIVLQISSKFSSTVYDRIASESITLFYIELVLFEESAICITNEQITDFFSQKQNRLPNNALRTINRIFKDYSKTIEFWDIQVNYPSSKKSLKMIRDAFGIEGLLKRLERNQNQLQQLFETQRDILDRIEASMLNYIVLTLTLLQLVTILLPFVFTTPELITSPKAFVFSGMAVVLIVFSLAKRLFARNNYNSGKNKNRRR